MYRKTLPLLAIALLTAGCAGNDSEAPEAEITAEEPTNIIAAELMANKARFVEAMSGLSADQWAFQEEDGRWSLSQIAEHLIKTEKQSLAGVRDGVLATEPTERQANPDSLDGFITMLLGDRTQRFQAPEGVQPQGIYATPEEAVAAFTSARDEMIAIAEENGEALRDHQMEHPIGATLDGHQWMLFVKAHADRHLAQAAEVKAHADYPASE
ncbi:MAG: DinB family protein [Rhodothermales bacterium]|nr:DinB family protein [Rhodothermales bacterium]MBO6779345.1 DinB family protein [Rhodothermales bacterium]